MHRNKWESIPFILVRSSGTTKYISTPFLKNCVLSQKQTLQARVNYWWLRNIFLAFCFKFCETHKSIGKPVFCLKYILWNLFCW